MNVDSDQIKIIAENAALRVAEKLRSDWRDDLQSFTDKILEQLHESESRIMESRQAESRDYEKRRGEFFELITGRPSSQATEVRKDIDFLTKLRHDSEQNRSVIKITLIRTGLPALAGVIGAWLFTHFK